MGRLQDKTAVVTGGTFRIGLATATLLVFAFSKRYFGCWLRSLPLLR